MTDKLRQCKKLKLCEFKVIRNIPPILFWIILTAKYEFIIMNSKSQQLKWSDKSISQSNKTENNNIINTINNW